MRNLFITFVVFSVATSLCAQTETNPFAKYGLKKVMMATFSKGEFEEFHKNKEIVEIGSVLYDTKTKEVIGYIDENIENDVTSATPAMSIDPHCESYPWISPYAYCANNPVRFIDPTGMDWYWTNYDDAKKRSLQYDPNITKDSKLGEGQKYAGVTYQVKDGDGKVIENYRKDGSILFANETTAYNRMWKQANEVNREQMAVIGDKNVLVLPEYLNDNTTSEVGKYGYSWKEGNITDKEGNTFSTLATIHTHQDDLKGEWGFIAPPGFDDQKYFPFATPNKPYFTMGYNGKIYGEIGNSSGRMNLSGIIPKGYNTINDLLKGAKFRLLIKSLK